MKYYKVPEDDLLELLAAAHELSVLKRDGVDNWTWYMEGREDYLQECYGNCTNYNKDFDFEDAAKIDIDSYEEIK